MTFKFSLLTSASESVLKIILYFYIKNLRMTGLESYRSDLHHKNGHSLDSLLSRVPPSVEIENGHCLLDNLEEYISLESASACLNLFIMENFIGPKMADHVPEWATKKVSNFDIDGENPSPFAKCLPLLLFSKDSLDHLLRTQSSKNEKIIISWWRWRCAQVFQRIIGSDRCPRKRLHFFIF